MPCWTVCTSTINLQNADLKLLEAALQAIGFSNVNKDNAYARERGKGTIFTADRFADRTSVTVMPNGTVNVTSAARGADMVVLGNEVKRAYSGQVIQSAATRFGWLLKPQDETGRKFAVMARS